MHIGPLQWYPFSTGRDFFKRLTKVHCRQLLFLALDSKRWVQNWSFIHSLLKQKEKRKSVDRVDCPHSNWYAPKFFQAPVMSGAVLCVLNLYSHDGPRERAGLVPLLRRHQVRGQWGVQRVRQQHELEHHLQRDIKTELVLKGSVLFFQTIVL